jgi:hypothetical protein
MAQVSFQGISNTSCLYLITCYPCPRFILLPFYPVCTFGSPHSDFQISKATGAKVYASDVAVEVCNKGMQLMGSYGYMKEHNVENTCGTVRLFSCGKAEASSVE